MEVMIKLMVPHLGNLFKILFKNIRECKAHFIRTMEIAN